MIRSRSLAAAAIVSMAAVGVTGCSEAQEADALACRTLQEVSARVEPLLERDPLPTVDDSTLSAQEQDVLSQWTFDLGDAAGAAADQDLRDALRRSADFAHDVYTGTPGALERYRDQATAAQERCSALQAG